MMHKCAYQQSKPASQPVPNVPPPLEGGRGRLLLLFLLLTTFSCTHAQKRLPDYLSRLSNAAEFESMAGAPLSAKLDGVHSVKVVYELRRARLYFLNSTRFRYHYNFTFDVLGNRQDLTDFNVRNYGDHPDREYLLVNLNHYQQSNRWALEFTSDDRPDTTDLRTLYDAVSANAAFLKDSLRLLISSDHLYTLSQSGRLAFPTVAPSDLYQGQRQQVLNPGEAYGYLRLLPDLRNEAHRVTAADIVVTRGTPAFVPLCAGIVTDELQTPLSHINVLSHNRNLPAAAQLDMWQRDGLKTLEGKPVRLVVSNDTVQISAATEADVAAFQKRKGSLKPTRLSLDTSVRRVLAAKDFGYAERRAVGNKAAGFGELRRITQKNPDLFKVPEGGFAIPFVFYARHLQRPAIRDAIRQLDVAVAAGASPDTVSARLKAIRKAIKAEPLDTALEGAVLRRMRAEAPYTAFRFRSSSNAEDAAGFSGAGLYDSKTGTLPEAAGAERPAGRAAPDGDAGDAARMAQPGSRRSAPAHAPPTPADAIRAVWASAWNDVAWRERRAYRIDEGTMMMGILCHRSFPAERANGVAITRHLYRAGFPGFTVNVQAGEVSVVAPPDDTTLAEQYISSEAKDISPINPDVVADYISRSNLTQGRPVLSADEVTRLHRALYRIKTWYYYRYVTGFDAPEFDDYALDVEFKFEQDGALYIKQVRPYR